MSTAALIIAALAAWIAAVLILARCMSIDDREPCIKEHRRVRGLS